MSDMAGVIERFPSYLNDSVLRLQPGAVSGGSWVQAADVLPRSGSITV